MINVTPSGEIYLCKTPLESDYKNQITFNNLQEQLNYFNSVIQKTYSNYTYIRSDNAIKVNGNIDDLITCNYLFYRNNGFTNKYYFCFITDMQYVNENVTLITFQTDVFQTWQFDINYKTCFIEREHVNDDSIGANTVPEALELGDYISPKNPEKMLTSPSEEFYICMGVSELPDESIPEYSNNRVYNGIFGGLYYLAFKTASDCETAIRMYDRKGKSSAINSVFMIPKNLTSVQDATSYTWTIEIVGSCEVLYLRGTNDADTLYTLNGEIPTTVGKSYIPKNNKLFTYPYSFMNLANNSGQTVPFRYEDFTFDEVFQTIVISFWIDACLTPGMSMKAVPLFYKNVNINYNYGVMLGKLPICSWNSDVYLNWLTQNGLNSAFKLIGSTVSTATGIASGNVSGAVSGVTGIYNAIHEITIADITPNQANGNTNSGDVNFANDDDGGITLYYVSIRDEYAKIIDDYFNMFGYKINRVKLPNITGRKNWNYVKTIDCNFDGNMPQSAISTIRSMFNSGVTLWHSASVMYNYDLDNSII